MLRRIDATTLQQLKTLLVDDQIDVAPIAVQYEKCTVRNKTTDPESPLEFQWWRAAQTEPLSFNLTTWNTQESQKFPNTYLTLGTDKTPRIVGFPLYWLPQDDDFIYLSFKLGNNEGGKNRWFGRARTADETRSLERTNQLASDLRQTLQQYFPEPLLVNPSLPGDWLTLAKLPLAQLHPNTNAKQKSALKTLILQQLLQAFIIAEKLRADSFTASNMTTDTPDLNQFYSFPTAFTSVHPLNQILYGPPGTGKTYSTAEWALAMLQNRSVADVREQYQHRHAQVRKELARYRKREQVQFVTFHQSFSYEDFVEGIKPKLTGDKLAYRVEPGVFQQLSQAAKRAWQYPGQVTTAAAPVADFDTVYAAYIQHLQEELKPSGTIPVQTMTGAKAQIIGIKNGDVIVMKHEGSQYSFSVGKKWSALVYEKYERAEDIVPMNQKMLDIGGPNASLQWALFRHLKTFEQQHFPAEQNPDATALAPITAADGLARFVLIIDEVNRGNVASIFGELITLLEDDKRAGQTDEQSVQLPYSKNQFSVPPNLHLLGTMNTADRSVEALDTALRRRFAFVEMPPLPQLLSPAQMVARLWWRYEELNWNDKVYLAAEQPLYELLGCPLTTVAEQGPLWDAVQKGQASVLVLQNVKFTGVNLQRLLDVINQRLEYLLGRDYRLGHAWLMNVGSLEQLRQAFHNKVIPQLQEYFYGNWGRIGQILGSGFIVKTADADSPLLVFEDEPDGEGRSRYEISAANWTIQDFQAIYMPQP